ncbi:MULTISPECIES: universal stress protein [Pseudomonas]|uniref:universal stress protein n=1 Tax=Pseudomonas TaxID=286 RepID=UPI000A1ED500|nr:MULTISPECIES: universal stress protein [Pseudomonas]UIN54301.1 universal stress protein [Pseudomonas kribbensis]
MSQYQRLLLIINPLLRESGAINHAAALARASGARLHILALIPSPEGLSLLETGNRQQAREAFLQDHRQTLEARAVNLRGRRIEVTIEVKWAADVEQRILDHVKAYEPDLLIKEIEQVSALRRAFYTPLDWQLLRDCPVPVYLVGGSGYVLPRKVLAAVEVSDIESADNSLNEQIIRQANALAIQCDAELHLLYACDISAGYLADMGGLPLAELTRSLREDLQKSFLRLAGHFGVASSQRHFIEGRPVTVLSEFADEQHVDVIVMGRVRKRGLSKWLGSTTEHILYQVPCCVLAV